MEGGDWNAHSPTPQQAGKRTGRDASRGGRLPSTCLRSSPHRVRWRQGLSRRTRPQSARMGSGSGSPPAVRGGLAAPRIRGLVPSRRRIVARARTHQNRRRIPSGPGTTARRQRAVEGAAGSRKDIFANEPPRQTQRVVLAGTRLSPMPFVPQAHDVFRFSATRNGPRHLCLAASALARGLSSPGFFPTVLVAGSHRTEFPANTSTLEPRTLVASAVL